MRGSASTTTGARLVARCGLAAALAAAAAAPVVAQSAAAPAAGVPPFFAGESLSFRATASRGGASGRGAMWVEGPVDVRGAAALVLRFEIEAGFGPLRAVDRTASWLDPARMASLRYRKHERHPLSRRDEDVELVPGERRWTARDGASGASPTDAPLDELSFIYFLRTLPLDADTTMRFERHFDPARSPTRVRVLRRETVTVPAGTFRAVAVEMRVRDPRRYGGEGVIRIHLSDDHCRLPLRIESAMPLAGTAVLALARHNHAGAHHVASAAR